MIAGNYSGEMTLYVGVFHQVFTVPDVCSSLVNIAATILLGKLSYFTNLTTSTKKGDDFPDSKLCPVRENSGVVIKTTQ